MFSFYSRPSAVKGMLRQYITGTGGHCKSGLSYLYRNYEGRSKTRIARYRWTLSMSLTLCHWLVPSVATILHDLLLGYDCRAVDFVLRFSFAMVSRRRHRVLFHQDNAPAHTSSQALAAIRNVGFELLPHPLYSPDLAPVTSVRL